MSKVIYEMYLLDYKVSFSLQEFLKVISMIAQQFLLFVQMSQ